MPLPHLHLRDTGAGADVALLVHGFPFTGAIWDHQLARAPAGWRILAPDLPGFGRSPAVAPLSVDALADTLVALLDELRLERAVVGGLSMGGYVAFALWRRHRARVRALVLADTRAAPDTAEARQGRARTAAEVREHGVEAVVSTMLPRLLSEHSLARRPALVARLRAIMEEASVPGVVAALQALAGRPDATPTLATIAVPTLVLAGEEDRLTPPAEMEAMARAIPGARFRRIPGAGHVSCLEAPDHFTTRLNAFLETLPA